MTKVSTPVQMEQRNDRKNSYIVTVVIPNYNGMKFIKECLDSLLNQEPDTPPYKVVVVDNASTDGSLEWLLERFYASVPSDASDDSAWVQGPGQQAFLNSVTILPQATNTGFCHAVNVGIEAADTPYVLLLNNDTKVKSNFIKNLTGAIEAKPDAFSVSAKMLMWDAKKKMWVLAQRQP